MDPQFGARSSRGDDREPNRADSTRVGPSTIRGADPRPSHLGPPTAPSTYDEERDPENWVPLSKSASALVSNQL